MDSATPVLEEVPNERANYFKLSILLVNYGSMVLRKLLISKSIKDHAEDNVTSFQGVLAIGKIKKNLTRLHEKERKITPKQWNLLYPENAMCDVNTFDISLLSILIRNTCKLQKPDKGWNDYPPDTDRSLEAELVRIRHFRNEDLMHTSRLELPDEDFNEKFDKIKETILAIKQYLPDIQDLEIEIDEKKIEDVRHHRLNKDDIKACLVAMKNERQLQDAERRKEACHITTKLDEMNSKLEEYLGHEKPKKRKIDETILQPDSQFCEDIKDDLKDRYMTTMFEVQRIPWDETDKMPIDSIFINLLWLQQLDNNMTTQKIPLRNYLQMFTLKRPSDGRLPRRILILGRAGIGKSTFVQKVCIDWSRGETEELTQYKLLFALSLAEITKDCDLCDLIVDQNLPDIPEEKKDILKEFIQKNQKEVLLVLDGYDEYGRHNDIINDIIDRKRYKDICVLLTSRPYKAEDLRQMKLSDALLEIDGYKDAEDVKRYVQKYLSYESSVKTEEVDAFMNHVDQYNMLDFVKTPLLLLLMCLLYTHHKGVLPKRVTEIYTTLLEFMFKRYEQTKGGCSDSEMLLLNLGKLSFDALLDDNNTLLEKEDIEKKVGQVAFKLGLISRHKVRGRIAQNYKVSFLHKTLQEYLSARYIISLDKDANDFASFIQKLNTVDVIRDMEMVLMFCCGLADRSKISVAKILLHADVITKEKNFIRASFDFLTKCIQDNEPFKEDCAPMRILNFVLDLEQRCIYETKNLLAHELDDLTIGSYMYINKRNAHAFAESEFRYKPFIISMSQCSQEDLMPLLPNINCSDLAQIQMKNCKLHWLMIHDLLKKSEASKRAIGITLHDIQMHDEAHSRLCELLQGQTKVKYLELQGLGKADEKETMLKLPPPCARPFLPVNTTKDRMFTRLVVVNCDPEVVKIWTQSLALTGLTALKSSPNEASMVLKQVGGILPNLKKLTVTETDRTGNENIPTTMNQIHGLLQKHQSLDFLELQGCRIEYGANLPTFQLDSPMDVDGVDDDIDSNWVERNIFSMIGELLHLRDLVIQKCQFGKTGLGNIGKAVACLPNLILLDISNNAALSGNMKTFTDGTQGRNLPSLKDFKVVNAHLKEIDMIPIVRFVNQAPCFTRLFLYEDPPKDPSIPCPLGPLFDNLEHLPQTMTNIGLQGQNISGKLEKLAEKLQYLRSLRVVSLAQNHIGCHAKILLKYMPHFQNIDFITLGDNGVSQDIRDQLEDNPKKIRMTFIHFK